MNTRSNHPALIAGLVAVALFASSCGDMTKRTTGPGTNLTQDTADDVALQVGLNLQSTGLEVEAAATSVAGSAPVQGTAATQAQVFDTTFARNGITFEITRTFYGPLGEELPGYGPTAVRMVWTSRAYGTIETTRDTATIGHSGSLDVHGIQATKDTLTFAGLALDTLTNHFMSFDNTRERFMHAVSSLEYADVLLLKARDVNPWPLSGTATYDLVADRLRSNDLNDVETHLTAHVVVTFNGTSTPDIVVSGSFHYRFNLITGQLIRV